LDTELAMSQLPSREAFTAFNILSKVEPAGLKSRRLCQAGLVGEAYMVASSRSHHR